MGVRDPSVCHSCLWDVWDALEAQKREDIMGGFLEEMALRLGLMHKQ